MLQRATIAANCGHGLPVTDTHRAALHGQESSWEAPVMGHMPNVTQSSLLDAHLSTRERSL
jgi:hypothetical protein